MAASVNQILDAIDEIAPFATQEAWDNAGLLAGHPNRSIGRVLVALDLTPGVVDEAQHLGAELVVTHHPILFHPRKNLREDDVEGAVLCRLVRAELALIAAHTNFDIAEGGVNDELARVLGLTGVQPLENGLRMGQFGGTFLALCEAARLALGGVMRPYGGAGCQAQRIAVCGGSGGSFWKTALDAGADVLLTGEVRHSDALEAVGSGLALVEAGHYATERPSVKAMRNSLQNKLDALQYNVMVFDSEVEPF